MPSVHHVPHTPACACTPPHSYAFHCFHCESHLSVPTPVLFFPLHFIARPYPLSNDRRPFLGWRCRAPHFLFPHSPAPLRRSSLHAVLYQDWPAWVTHFSYCTSSLTLCCLLTFFCPTLSAFKPIQSPPHPVGCPRHPLSLRFADPLHLLLWLLCRALIPSLTLQYISSSFVLFVLGFQFFSLTFLTSLRHPLPFFYLAFTLWALFSSRLYPATSIFSTQLRLLLRGPHTTFGFHPFSTRFPLATLPLPTPCFSASALHLVPLLPTPTTTTPTLGFSAIYLRCP